MLTSSERTPDGTTGAAPAPAPTIEELAAVCSRTIARPLVMSIPFLVVAALAANAASVRYAWSGRVEPLPGEANPWGLTGDGSAVTSSDGTPFQLEAFVDEAALDEDGTLNPDFAAFAAVEATLVIGDRRALLAMPVVTFGDDAFEGSFDSVGFDAEAELFATTLSFAADVRLPATSFDLASPGAPDPPPLFPETAPTQFGGTVRSILLTMPANAPVRADPVPWAAFPAASAVEWVDGTLGFAGDLEVTITGLGEPSVVFYDLSIPEFTAAPFFSLTPSLDYETGSTWTVTFSEPVATLLLYTRFWRGAQGGADPVTYHFDVPFSIRSGLEQASILGNFGGLILSLPGSGFHDGVVQIPGPLTSLTVTPNTSTGSQQAMSMAVVPLPRARAVDWSTPSSGSAGTIDVTLADLAVPALDSGDLSGADFAAAALSASEDLLDYDVGSDWTATLSETAPGLLVYARSWRGTSAGVDPVTYRFDTPFTILSGLRDAVVTEDGTLLTLPADGFHDGILFFPGPLASLSVDANSTASSAQQMTLAVVPEPGATAGGMAALAVLMTLCRRRPRGPLLLVLAALVTAPAQAVPLRA